MATLYKLTRKLADALEFGFDIETGEIADAEFIDKINIGRDEKIEGVALAVKNYNADAKAIKEERDELYKRQKAAEAKAEWLKGYLTKNLGDGETFKSPKVALSWRKSESVEVLDLAALPKEYIKVKEEANKTAIKQALKSGTEIAGAALVTNNNLQIK